MNGRIKIVTLISLFLLIRLFISFFVPLTIDESYAIAVSRSHSLSYFDHPPLGFALARLMADLFACECRFVVRLPYVLLGSLSAILLFDLTRRAYGEVAGFWAAAWYSVAPFFFIASGHFVLPDGPLNFGLLLCVWALVPEIFRDEKNIPLWRWCLSGIALGIALLSKYQAVLFGASALAFFLTTRAGWKHLASAGPWLALGLAALGLAPVIIWNAEHRWISFAFQSGRALTDGGTLLHPANLLVTLVGQIGYVWPPTWFIAMLMLMRSMKRDAAAADRFFGIMAVLPIGFFDIVSLFTRSSLPHWSMSGFLFAFPLVGKWSATLFETNPRRLRVSFAAATALVCVLTATFVVQLRTAIFTRSFFEQSPTFDMDWQSLDWTEVKEAIPAKALSGNAFVAAANWAQAAKIALALGPDVPIVVLPGDPRHFQFIRDPRVSNVCEGFFVGAVRFGRELQTERSYRAQLDASDYAVGAPLWTIQKIAGYPVFKLLAFPVSKEAPCGRKQERPQ